MLVHVIKLARDCAHLEFSNDVFVGDFTVFIVNVEVFLLLVLDGFLFGFEFFFNGILLWLRLGFIDLIWLMIGLVFLGIFLEGLIEKLLLFCLGLDNRDFARVCFLILSGHILFLDFLDVNVT